MALDMNKVRERLTRLQHTQTRKDSTWKPKNNHVIRIVPYKFDKTNPFIELYFHYRINNKTYLSPISSGNADPFVEFAEKLRATGDQEDWKSSRKFQPKLRTYVPMIERGKEDEGVKFWGFGKTVYETLLGYISDPDYGDITDVKTGRDITIEYVPAKGKEDFASTNIRIKPNRSPLTTDKDIFMKLLDNQVEITEVFEEPTYEELDEVLQKWLNPESNVSEEKSEEKQQQPITKTGLGLLGDDNLPFELDDESSDTKLDDIGKEFDSLFKD